MGRKKRTFFHLLGNIVTVITSLVVVIPLVVLFLNSFKSSAEANRMTLSLPKNG